MTTNMSRHMGLGQLEGEPAPPGELRAPLEGRELAPQVFAGSPAGSPGGEPAPRGGELGRKRR